MRIYAACLAAYNNGRLHGRWIEASTDIEEMQTQINLMLRSSPRPDAEEWAIHDHEGLGDLGPYAGLAEVARRVAIAGLAEERDIPLVVLLDYAGDYMSGEWDVADLEREIDDRYRGTADTWADFAEEWHTDCGDLESLPEWVRYHIDWEGIGRDFELSGDFSAYTADDRTLYIFWSH